MPFTRVASLKDLRPGEVLEVSVDGRLWAVCNSGEGLYALDGTCPHHGGPLGQGALHGSTLVCPWHAWEFDCRTGEWDRDAQVRVATRAVKVLGEDIFLDA